jgi:hypothetical protein
VISCGIEATEAVSETVMSWLDIDTTITVSMTADEVANVAVELKISVLVRMSVELVESKSGMIEVDDPVASKLEEDRSATELIRLATDVSVADTMISLIVDISVETEASVELSRAANVDSFSIGGDVSRTEEITSGVVIRVVEFAARVSVIEDMLSIVVLGKLLVALGVVIVEDAEEMTRELDDDAVWHLPLTLRSAFSGAVSVCAGRVKVHSLSSFIFLTPRRESRRYALA